VIELAIGKGIPYTCEKMNSVPKKIAKYFLCTALAVSVFFCGQSFCAEKNLKKVSFATLWLPQAQFAGYYVALKKGFYKKYGLEVTIVNGAPDNPASSLLESGKVDFSVMWLSAAIEKRSQGIPLVNVCQFLQRSGLMLVAKKSSGIYEIADMNDRKVGLWSAEFEIQPKAFFEKYGLNMKIVPQAYTVNLFLRGGVDVASAMWYNEYHTIINSGYDPEELTTFFFYEHGLNFPEDGIYALERTLGKDPDIARAFVAASMEGWIYAFEHVDEAVSIVMEYMTAAHLPATRVHQKWQLERMRDLAVTDGSYKGLGVLHKEDFDNTAKLLKESGIIKNIPEFGSFRKECGTYDKN